MFILLDAMNAWEDSTEGGSEWLEVLQIVERVLYHACLQKDNKDLIENLNYQLTQLLHKRVVVDKDEACYQIYNLNGVLLILEQLGMYFQKFVKIEM